MAQHSAKARHSLIGNFYKRSLLPDTETDSRAFREILILARTETLTTYDAAYLELAIRRGTPLATLDKALIRAANRVEVKTLPLAG